jgi:hypothetical protein
MLPLPSNAVYVSYCSISGETVSLCWRDPDVGGCCTSLWVTVKAKAKHLLEEPGSRNLGLAGAENSRTLEDD